MPWGSTKKVRESGSKALFNSPEVRITLLITASPDDHPFVIAHGGAGIITQLFLR